MTEIVDEHISPYVGGAFGSGLRTWPHVTLAALAARQVGRPVRLELTRRELSFSIGYRGMRQIAQIELGGVDRLTGDFLRSVDPADRLANYCVHSRPPAASTARSTARRSMGTLNALPLRGEAPSAAAFPACRAAFASSIHGGSVTLVSVGNAVVETCRSLRHKLQGLGGDSADVLRQRGVASIEAIGVAKPGEETEKYSSAAFGAVFAEVSWTRISAPSAYRGSSAPMTSAG